MAFNFNLDRNNIYTEGAEKLPTDQAYVCKIIAAKEVDQETNGYRIHRLEIALDITEGEYANYYQDRFNADKERTEDAKWKGVVRLNIPKGDGTEKDGWTMKTLNTALYNIEVSNAGYTWDNVLEHLKGKAIGLVLRDKEYEINGSTGFYSEPFKLITVQDAKDQKFRKPAVKYLANKSTPATPSEGFVPIPDTDLEEIPF